MVAADREIEALRERVRAAFDFADAAPVNVRGIVVLLIAGHFATMAADALRHVEVEAVLLAVGRGKSAGRRREVRSFFGD